MAAEFRLKIVSPEGVFLDDQADLLEMFTAGGQIGVMAGHARLITALEMGELLVQRKGQRERFYAGGGFVRVYPEHVLVMACSIRPSVSLQEFDALRGRLEELMADSDHSQIAAACDRARDRLEHARKAGGNGADAELGQGRIVSELKRKRGKVGI